MDINSSRGRLREGIFLYLLIMGVTVQIIIFTSTLTEIRQHNRDNLSSSISNIMAKEVPMVEVIAMLVMEVAEEVSSNTTSFIRSLTL